MEKYSTEYQLQKRGISELRRKVILKILKTFDSQEHSGITGSYTIQHIDLYIEKGRDYVLHVLNNALDKAYQDKDDDAVTMQIRINKQIIKMLNLFDKFNLNKEELKIILRILNCLPIIPLTGEDDEWRKNELNISPNTDQNKLYSAVFRENHDNNMAVTSDGVIFSENGGVTWFGNGDSIIPIKFPYEVPDSPKEVYLNGKNSKEVITDEKRIKELRDSYLAKLERKGDR